MARDLKLDLDGIRSGLTSWLARKLPGAQNLHLSPFRMPGMGASNETFLFDLHWREGSKESTEKLVVRWSPMRTPLYPRYDMKEQFRLLERLRRTEVPVPRVRWLEEDDSVIGQPFYVMDRIDGWIPPDTPSYHQQGPLVEGSPEYRASIWREGVDTLVRIHSIDWRDLGLGFLGAPGTGADPIHRHIAYYQKMIEMTDQEPSAILLESGSWLRKSAILPPRLTLCWGDARLGNLVFRDGRVVGVLDWEMALLGDPASDLLWFLLMDWALSEGHFVAPSARLGGLPGREETLAHYEQATNRKLENRHYHDVFATWRFAVIMHRADSILKATGYHQPDVDVHTTLENRLRDLLGL